MHPTQCRVVGAAPVRDSRLLFAFTHNRTGTVTYVRKLNGPTEGELFVAGDAADDIEMLRTRDFE